MTDTTQTSLPVIKTDEPKKVAVKVKEEKKVEKKVEKKEDSLAISVKDEGTPKKASTPRRKP